MVRNYSISISVEIGGDRSRVDRAAILANCCHSLQPTIASKTAVARANGNSPPQQVTKNPNWCRITLTVPYVANDNNRRYGEIDDRFY